MPDSEKTNKKNRQFLKRRCPKCMQETNNKRIHRSLFTKWLLVWFRLERYQCTVCKLKFHLRRKIKSKD